MDSGQAISAGQFPTAKSGPIAQFLTSMPDWMKPTPEDLNLASETLPIPLKGPITPGRSLQVATSRGQIKGMIHT